MAWDRFGYICRRVIAETGENESVLSCLSRVEGDKSGALYGKPLSRLSLPKKILEEIGSLDNEDSALYALDIYQGLNLSEKLEEPMMFKRVVAYLSYVTFVFYVVVGVYQLKVAPTFLNAFSDFGLSAPRHLIWYQDWWWYIVLAISMLLIASLVIGYHLREMFRFNLGIENSFVFKFFILGRIRRSYAKVIDILLFPISSAVDQHEKSRSELFRFLQEIEGSDMSVAIEMQALLRIEMRNLLEGCEQQMKYISTFVALAVVAAIFFFLASAYAPIFVLGEIV